MGGLTTYIFLNFTFVAVYWVDENRVSQWRVTQSLRGIWQCLQTFFIHLTGNQGGGMLLASVGRIQDATEHSVQ